MTFDDLERIKLKSRNSEVFLRSRRTYVLKNIFVLGFNEPNQHEQSNLEPELAAEAWIDIQVYKYKLNKDISCPL